MKRFILSQAVATVAITGLVAIAVTTTASAEEPAVATLELGTPGTLTLPAGDGVRDTTDLTIASDIATTVSISVVDPASSETLATLDPVEIADPSATATVAIPVTGLHAGNLELVVTPTEGESIVIPLTVGSGNPLGVGIDLDTDTIYSWSGATPTAAAATVTAYDETYLDIPFSGSVTAVVGGATEVVPVSSTDGTPATVDVAASGLAAGTGSVTAAVHGPSGVDLNSYPSTLTVVPTVITGVTLAKSVSTVYPVKDSYRDSVKFTVTPATDSDSAPPVTGTVKVTRSGKTVASWPFTTTSKASVTWDGKVAGKIVPGTYTVTVSAKGPEGPARTASTTVKVDSGKLVSKTKTITYKAASAFKKYASFGYAGANYCFADYPRASYIYCYAKYASADGGYALVGLGAVTVPSYVASAEAYGGAKVSTTLYSVTKSGTVDWYVGSESGTSRDGQVKTGTNALGSVTLPSGTKKVEVYLGLDKGEKVTAGSVKVTYTYRVMTH